FDVLALALDLRLEATLTVKKGPLEVEYRGTLKEEKMDPRNDILLKALARAMGKEREELEGIHLVVDSQIPVTRGLGSSAAALVAGILLGNVLSGSKQSAGEVHKMAYMLEGHREAVGAALFGGLVFAPPGVEDPDLAHPLPLPVHPSWRFAVAWPAMEVSTVLARSVLPPSLPHEVTPKSVGRTLLLLHGLKEADPRLVKLGIQDEVHVPFRRHLVPGFNKVREAALEAGASGITLSGSGPALVAPVLGEETGAKVVEAMIQAFRDSRQDAQGKLLDVAGRAQLEVLPPTVPS
ncbi:MAG TPA: homoserine kinase, partial [Planctomycetes bacterium]|nr:homoserine kinase [Planctomycetota bacterium]